MKIEKINDKQLKILLTASDLEKRDIKMTELAFGSDKTRELFKEMMNIATDKYDFDAGDAQLMIEAIPISMEAIIIMVTKMEDAEAKPKSKKLRKNSVQKDGNDKCLSIFEFNSLDDVTHVAQILYGQFTGTNYLLKHDNKYYLMLQNDSQFDDITNGDLEIMIGEYGRKHSVNAISRAFLFEHGEVIIDGNAVDVLSEYL